MELSSTPITAKLSAARSQLMQHPVYHQLSDIRSVQRFMEIHVFAVWDFMSLLKRLQQEIAGSKLPWLPSHSPALVRMINEIVLVEESDQTPSGEFMSHFAIYLGAMREIGADTSRIARLIEMISSNVPIHEALKQAEIWPPVADFVRFHLQLAADAPLHQVAASFFYGREDIIPEMFESLLPMIQGSVGETALMHFYVRRHIEVDGQQHGQQAAQLLSVLCNGSEQKIREVNEIAVQSIEYRIRLWDFAQNYIQN